MIWDDWAIIETIFFVYILMNWAQWIKNWREGSHESYAKNTVLKNLDCFRYGYIFGQWNNWISIFETKKQLKQKTLKKFFQSCSTKWQGVIHCTAKIVYRPKYKLAITTTPKENRLFTHALISVRKRCVIEMIWGTVNLTKVFFQRSVYANEFVETFPPRSTVHDLRLVYYKSIHNS